MHRVKGRGADADVELVDGLLVVRWHGLVAMAGAESVKRAIYWALQDPVAAIVSDYSKATVALNDAECVRIMLGGPNDMGDLPATVVTKECTWDVFYRASLTAAALGRWRYVSRDFSEALHVARGLRGRRLVRACVR
jgi:hypothetical protein